jgi:mannitol/fructose-specific phosphotransferase system IIA component (Ntr-type)
MSYFHSKIVEIIKKVKSPQHAADEIIQMLEDEGILESEDGEEDDDSYTNIHGGF